MFVLLGCADTQKYMAHVCYFLTKTQRLHWLGDHQQVAMESSRPSIIQLKNLYCNAWAREPAGNDQSVLCQSLTGRRSQSGLFVTGFCQYMLEIFQEGDHVCYLRCSYSFCSICFDVVNVYDYVRSFIPVSYLF